MGQVRVCPSKLRCQRAMAGMNVLYLTFELSENLVMRIDSMVRHTAEIYPKNVDDVEMKVQDDP
ncbi:MAG: hypothetical protein CM15mP106_4670 [Candidatus Neomarinimicrobiota bacterium]|nr:MAG: hypothetical protein CM15mP106_4670 [Candidatus Neomarinimicrobiota bacterium]